MTFMKSLAVPLVAFASSSLARPTTRVQNAVDTYSQIFTSIGSVPDILPYFYGTPLRTTYPTLDAPLQPGQAMSVAEATARPTFWAAPDQNLNPDIPYVVIMLDPDAPGIQDRHLSLARHLIQQDMYILPNGQFVNATPALSEQVFPTPIDAPHRYSIFLFEQPDGFTSTASSILKPLPEGVTNFDILDFMAQTGLQQPVAGTFFLCGGDDVVNHTSASYGQAFADAGLVPKPLGVFAPEAVLDVTYPSAVSNGSFLVFPGLNVTEDQVVSQPDLYLTFESTGLSQDAAGLFTSTFVLFALDPDAPTPQNTSLANFVHWVQPNLKISGPMSTFAPLVNSTPALFEYLSPAPPATSDAHRYAFVLFEQPEGFEEAAVQNIPADRTSFDLDAFAKAVGLDAPVAGTFFRTGANVTFPSPMPA
ncbi:unnamed protein product [Peniophora sp. CBMAI 1063]|nr:unnamed protein product [Peniophora sp. CBMAI 1063]